MLLHTAVLHSRPPRLAAPCARCARAAGPTVCYVHGRRSPREPESHVDPHKLLNVDVEPMLADPGSLGRVADHVLDWEMKEQPPRHKIVARHPPEAPAAPPPAAPQAAAEQPHEHSYYLDPHHLQNVDLDPLESDPGDVGRVAPGVLEEFEHLNREGKA